MRSSLVSKRLTRSAGFMGTLFDATKRRGGDGIDRGTPSAACRDDFTSGARPLVTDSDSLGRGGNGALMKFSV